MKIAFSGYGNMSKSIISGILNSKLAFKKDIYVFEVKNYRPDKLISKKNFLKSGSQCAIKFDLIFLDPPYKHKKLEILLNNIQNKFLLKENGIIVLHRHKDTKDSFPTGFKILEEKNYGISRVIFISCLY